MASIVAGLSSSAQQYYFKGIPEGTTCVLRPYGGKVVGGSFMVFFSRVVMHAKPHAAR